ncbi:hypothetical protein ASG01_15405 [Chryseobacterium sp. Leaf180]|uniref:hypothetical protein n=1 Tax=Chryseobacterium sp. Leaf180 TaxID=1736289 RepID=UPI0006F38D48|nr:hypothetical protein [Chryseobacterium sp. Leaf180]KQR94207.1 hypothetical protein ASG01_15405 [Chryseobacterium sp. Leaf180]
MTDQQKRLIKKSFENKTGKVPEKIRIGNGFVDDYIFEDHGASDIPINALRVIFNIISIISNEQFRPADRPKQLSLFDEEFETENNIFASMSILNTKISPSGTTKQVIDAYEYLAKFKMRWYKSINSKGREIRTFGGLISTPSYDKRGYTSFLISSYWLKKIMVIPEYNYVLYNLVYKIKNNKHIIFAIWLSKIPEHGTMLKLTTLNRKFGLSYKTANDLCFKFLKQVRANLDQYNNLSFKYRYKADQIFVTPYQTSKLLSSDVLFNADEQLNITYRLGYFRRKYHLSESEMYHFSHQYRNIAQTRDMIEKSYKEFIRRNRLLRIKSSNFRGKEFLGYIQELMIEIYRSTKAGQLFPNGYAVII